MGMTWGEACDEGRLKIAALARERAEQVETMALFPTCDGVRRPCPGDPVVRITTGFQLKRGLPPIGTFCERCAPKIERLAWNAGLRVISEGPIEGLL